MFNYILQTFLSYLEPITLLYLFCIPLGALLLIRLVDGIMKLWVAIRFHHLKLWPYLREEISSYGFYVIIWTLLYVVAIALMAISALSIASFYAGGMVTGFSVLTVWLVMVVSAVYSIIDNWQKIELETEDTGFVGDRRFFWNAIKMPFKKFLDSQGEATWAKPPLGGQALKAMKLKGNKVRIGSTKRGYKDDGLAD